MKIGTAVFTLLVLAVSPLAQAQAQPYPNKVIRVINPWAPGGPADALVRLLTTGASETLGQPIIVESKAGANGTIGTAFVSKAAPDGYTILFSHQGPMAIAPALMKNKPYDPIKDFEPITQVTAGPTLLVVRNDIPVKDVKELVSYAKANPGKLSYGSVGIGSSPHLAGELLAIAAGIDIVHVPYKGSAPILVDLLGGRISFAFIGLSGVIQQVQAGQLRAIAITTPKRSPAFPEYPAVSETLPGFELVGWYGFAAPAGTPKPIVLRLQQAFVAVLKKPDVAEWLKKNSLEAVGSTPEEHASQIKLELVKWAKVVETANIPLE